MKTIDSKERAKLILFYGYDFNDFITLTDRKTKEVCYIVINK